LWLIPMGWCALQSMTMPRALGWILMAGGVGYIVSGFVDFLAGNASNIVYALTVPASIGEFWMVGYLLVKGLNPDPRPSRMPPNGPWWRRRIPSRAGRSGDLVEQQVRGHRRSVRADLSGCRLGPCPRLRCQRPAERASRGIRRRYRAIVRDPTPRKATRPAQYG
jgi:hypothetical protein